MYGSFNCITFDHSVVEAIPLYRNGQFVLNEERDSSPNFACSIWGPTCDSIDLIGKDLSLPEMKIGDWLVFRYMGAYTLSAASGGKGILGFNGFAQTRILYTITDN